MGSGSTKVDRIITGANEVVTGITNSPGTLRRLNDVSIAVADGRIAAVETDEAIEKGFDTAEAEYIDASGSIVLPGYVDCHTHLVFGFSRAKEYALKMTESIAEIEKKGILTGIPASIEMTRRATEEQLYADALDRLQRMLRHGTTTVESKSGYGINRDDELKILMVNQRLAASQPVDIVSTFLGAHDFPPEIDRLNQRQRLGYIDELVTDIIPEVAQRGLAEFCDIYCDEGYYTAEEAKRILRAGIDNGLGAKIHADAYATIGGVAMAAQLPAVSADHLNYTPPEELSALAANGVVGVVLPALDFAVAHPQPFTIAEMVDRGVTLALGTNLNPGNWTESMKFVMVLACRNHGFSLEQAVLASTIDAARAIRREGSIGSLEVGKQADMQIVHLPSLEHIIYRLDCNPVSSVIKNGQVVV
ncbi:MAG: imidazolonepropionase [Deltaproteobacteria bacterium]|nr:MAG: imidazolonepropionase [Deltaproteobacteria bacterium]